MNAIEMHEAINNMLKRKSITVHYKPTENTHVTVYHLVDFAFNPATNRMMKRRVPNIVYRIEKMLEAKR